MESVAGAFLILLPIAFNVFFFLLARRFDYPNILRSPTEDILSRFHAGGVGLKLVWFGFMLTAVLFAPLAVLMGQVLAPDGLAVVPTATVVGVLAAVVQFLGLPRWPFLVPALARAQVDPASTPAMTRSDQGGLRRLPPLPRGWDRRMPRLPVHRSLESSGRHCDAPVVRVRGVARLARDHCRPLPRGRVARIRRPIRGARLEACGCIVPIAYVAWSIWLLFTGLVLLVG